MICKNCIHYDVCQYHIDEETTMTVNECAHEFIHKDQYVKLPVFVGQDIWDVYQSAYSKQVMVVKGKISMIQQKADKSWKVRISNRYGTEDFKAGDVNKYIFLTRAAAEEALSKLNEVDE